MVDSDAVRAPRAGLRYASAISGEVAWLPFKEAPQETVMTVRFSAPEGCALDQSHFPQLA